MVQMEADAARSEVSGLLPYSAANFGDSYFSDETLQAWGHQEHAWLAVDSKETYSVQWWLQRAACTSFIQQLTEHMRLPPGSFAQAVTLLDIYCQQERAQGEERAALLPGACAAICSLLCKADEADTRPDVASLAKATAWFSERLQESGWLPEGALAEARDLHESEIAVLLALEWQIHLPTTTAWLSAFCARFNTGTEGALAPSLEYVLQRGSALCDAVLRSTTAFQLAPQCLAVGVLCHGLVAARLLPLEAFRPASLIDRTEFEDLFVLGQGMPLPECVTPEAYQQAMLELLMLVTTLSLDEIQRHCLAFARSSSGNVVAPAGDEPPELAA